jgi:hypothetical protein
VPGNVTHPMAVRTHEPLLIKPVGMLGDAGEIYRFICSRLLRHDFTALFAFFSRHCFPPWLLDGMQPDFGNHYVRNFDL